MKKVIESQNAPAAIGPYSQAVQYGNMIFTSGQLPIDPATGKFPEGGIEEQTKRSLANVRAILEEAGFKLSDIVKTTVYLSDIEYFAGMNEVYKATFSAPFPARSAFAVKDLPLGALVEIEVVAAK